MTLILMIKQLPKYKIQKYLEKSNVLLPQYCPKCGASQKFLMLDYDDNSVVYCASHFGEFYIQKAIFDWLV